MSLITIQTLNLNIEMKEVHKLGLNILQEVLNLKSITMTSKQELQQLLSDIASSTANIAADLDRLATQAEGGLSAADADEFATQLRGLASNLKTQADRNPEAAEPDPNPTPEV